MEALLIFILWMKQEANPLLKHKHNSGSTKYKNDIGLCTAAANVIKENKSHAFRTKIQEQ